MIVVAQTDPDKGALGFSLLAVERGMEASNAAATSTRSAWTRRTPPNCPSPT